MKHIGVVTKDRRIFNNFISITLDDNPRNEKYIQIDERLLFQGREFEMIYFMCYKLPDIITVRCIQDFIEKRNIPFKHIY